MVSIGFKVSPKKIMLTPIQNIVVSFSLGAVDGAGEGNADCLY